jgi:hypothetical protein
MVQELTRSQVAEAYPSLAEGNPTALEMKKRVRAVPPAPGFKEEKHGS